MYAAYGMKKNIYMYIYIYIYIFVHIELDRLNSLHLGVVAHG